MATTHPLPRYRPAGLPIPLYRLRLTPTIPSPHNDPPPSVDLYRRSGRNPHLRRRQLQTLSPPASSVDRRTAIVLLLHLLHRPVVWPLSELVPHKGRQRQVSRLHMHGMTRRLMPRSTVNTHKLLLWTHRHEYHLPVYILLHRLFRNQIHRWHQCSRVQSICSSNEEMSMLIHERKVPGGASAWTISTSWLFWGRVISGRSCWQRPRPRSSCTLSKY